MNTPHLCLNQTEAIHRLFVQTPMSMIYTDCCQILLVGAANNCRRFASRCTDWRPHFVDLTAIRDWAIISVLIWILFSSSIGSPLISRRCATIGSRWLLRLQRLASERCGNYIPRRPTTEETSTLTTAKISVRSTWCKDNALSLCLCVSLSLWCCASGLQLSYVCLTQKAGRELPIGRTTNWAELYGKANTMTARALMSSAPIDISLFTVHTHRYCSEGLQ